MNYWYTMIYCGASTLKDTTQNKKIKKHPELLPRAIAWVNLQYLMLCERSQTQKTIYCIIPFLWYILEKSKV